MPTINVKLTALQESIKNEVNKPNVDTVVVVTGRQVGKTHYLTRQGVAWAIKAYCQIGFFEPTYKQCKKVFKELKAKLGKIKAIKFNSSDLEIQFPNGSIIRFHTAENDNCRGFTYQYVLVDEACFVKGDIFQEAILGTISIALSNGSGKLILASTPKYKNWFYEYSVLEHEKVRTIRATSEQGGFIGKDLLDRYKKQLPDSVYRNEYLGEFLEAGNGLFEYSGKLVPHVEGEPTVGSIAGIDWGIEDDYTVLSIFGPDGTPLYLNRWRKLEPDEIIAKILKVLNIYKPAVYAETNGMGNVLSKLLKAQYPNTRAFFTTNKNKKEIVDALILAVKNKTIRLFDIDWLKGELDAFSVKIGKSGKVTYEARTGHDDAIDSIAIANYHLINKATVKVY